MCRCKNCRYADFYNEAYDAYVQNKLVLWVSMQLKMISTLACRRCKHHSVKHLTKAIESQRIFLSLCDVAAHVEFLKHMNAQCQHDRKGAARIIQKKILAHQYRPSGSMMRLHMSEWV